MVRRGAIKPPLMLCPLASVYRLGEQELLPLPAIKPFGITLKRE
jgi:hypothetical protein